MRTLLLGLPDSNEADLRRELLSCEPSGRLHQTIEFACELARRPVG
jgi:hypothetical protein